MTSPLTYLRKVIPHNSPVRLWYTRIKNASSLVLLPVNTNGIQLIGVTGTDGKTTTVEMMSHILNELNIPNITASSYAIKHNSKVLEMSKRTTSSASAVRRLLRTATTNDVQVVVLETSSHGMTQWRLFGITFDTAVLTNITHEHLNFHRTLENYRLAKKLLFTKYLKKGGRAILPTNDECGAQWCKELSNTLSYSPQDTNAITDKHGTAFIHDNTQYSMPMLGGYNAGNAIAAALAISSLNIQTPKPGFGVTVDDALQALSNFAGTPGRMQIVPTDDITIIVDFALTEKAMSSALATAREVAQGGTVIVVFGASGGQHDASVHPGLAKAAAEGADIAIVTDDEPYDGDPAEIRENLIKNIEKTNTNKQNQKLSDRATKCEYYNIADRREAIAHALSLTTSGDVVIVTGMGHYTSRTVAGKEVSWNDADVIAEELEKRQSNKTN